MRALWKIKCLVSSLVKYHENPKPKFEIARFHIIRDKIGAYLFQPAVMTGIGDFMS